MDNLDTRLDAFFAQESFEQHTPPRINEYQLELENERRTRRRLTIVLSIAAAAWALLIAALAIVSVLHFGGDEVTKWLKDFFSGVSVARYLPYICAGCMSVAIAAITTATVIGKRAESVN